MIEEELGDAAILSLRQVCFAGFRLQVEISL